MKKTWKKWVALGMTFGMMAGIAGCGLCNRQGGKKNKLSQNIKLEDTNYETQRKKINGNYAVAFSGSYGIFGLRQKR